MQRARKLFPELSQAVESFAQSKSRIQIIRTVPNTDSNIQPPKTLYILDSSFNPPSVAHLSLASSAHSNSSETTRPQRLMLLLSIKNADKAPAPASFAHRLSMMNLFAEDMIHDFKAHGYGETLTAVDIALSKDPYFTDKSAAISEEKLYQTEPTHVNLIGYDTLIRVFDRKYYPNHQPPLSALKPYFEKRNRLRVKHRPDDNTDAGTSSIDALSGWLKNLKEGGLEASGASSQWISQIDEEVSEEAMHVSSTKIRKAADARSWHEVQSMCTMSVAEWIQQERLYQGDSQEGN